MPRFVSFDLPVHLSPALADSAPIPLSRPLCHPPSSLHRRAAWRLHFVCVWISRPAACSMEVEMPALPPPKLGSFGKSALLPSPPSALVVWGCWPCTLSASGSPSQQSRRRGRGIRNVMPLKSGQGYYPVQYNCKAFISCLAFRSSLGVWCSNPISLKISSRKKPDLKFRRRSTMMGTAVRLGG